MSTSSTLRVGRTGAGYLLRIEGRGTLRESPAVQEFAREVLDSEPGTLVIDLGACDYLDSTFLGCLAMLHRRYGLGQPPRLLVSAAPEVSLRLLGSTRLDTFLNVTTECPDVLGQPEVLSPMRPGTVELGRHVLECHRRLAELGGPGRAAFERIADRLEQELVD